MRAALSMGMGKALIVAGAIVVAILVTRIARTVMRAEDAPVVHLATFTEPLPEPLPADEVQDVTIHSMVRAYSLACTSPSGASLYATVKASVYRAQVGGMTCVAEAGNLGAVAYVSGPEVALAFEPLTIVTGRVEPHWRVTYRYGDYGTVVEVDAAGRFTLKLYPGAGTLTVRDDQYKVRESRQVAGTRGGRIDLGTLGD